MRAPAEFRALVRATRVARGAARSWWVPGADPSRFVRCATGHGLVGLVARVLRLPSRPPVPDPVRGAIERAHAADAARALVSTSELVRVVTALEGAGVPTIAFKGPTLALLAHGDVAARTYGDLDMLVRPAQADRAIGSLMGAGYRTRRAWPGARRALLRAGRYVVEMHHAPSGVHLEVHTRIVPFAYACDLDHEAMWTARTPVAVAGRTVHTLAPAHLVHFLAVHGCKHEWERLAWLWDVAQLLPRLTTANWEAVHREALRTGTWRMVLVALGLARDVLGIEPPDPVATGLDRDRAVRPIVTALARRLAGRHARGPFRVWQYRRVVARMRERRRDRLRYVARTAVALTDEDLPVPRSRHLWRLGFVTRPLRLLHKAVVTRGRLVGATDL